jgi:uncharacterized membrane protein YphA (DoxX/SURF4 family)
MNSGIPIAQAEQAPHGQPWNRATRIAFRFCFTYFGLYCLATQFLGGLIVNPVLSFPGLGRFWPLRQITSWYATHVFHVTSALVYTGNSGDTIFYWIQTYLLLAVAAGATILWSGLDRRAEYVTLHKWFHFAIRLVVASQMFDYGMAKIIPTQFPKPSLITLVEPVGNLELTGVLWTAIGASPGYQMFTGWAEMLAGILLLVPRTTTLGALVGMMDMIQVWIMNMTFDIPLKQISFHLLLLTLFLIAPDVRRLTDFFVLGRPVGAPTDRPLFRTPRANHRAFVAQIAFGVYLVAMYTNLYRGYWYAEGGRGGPQSPLYGIWNVEALSINGQSRSPALNDYDRRWRRVIFDVPSSMAFQRTDDSFAHYDVSIDMASHSLTLTKRHSSTWKASFKFERLAADQLTLEGEMDRYRIRMDLRLVDLDSFRLPNGTFRWVAPPSS